MPVNFGEGDGDLGEVGGDRGIVRLSGSDHDLGGKIMGADFRERMMDLASRGERVSVSPSLRRLPDLTDAVPVPRLRADIDREELRVLENVNRPQAISRDLLSEFGPWRVLLHLN